MIRKRILLLAIGALLICALAATVLYFIGAQDAQEHKGARFVWNEPQVWAQSK